MKLFSVVGARPQFIKAATVSRAVADYNQQNPMSVINESIIHTGQHFDYGMSAVFFEKLKMPQPMINLGINSCTHGEMTGRMLIEIENVFIRQAPDWVIVYGDTNSTLAAALAAAKLHIPVAHVEAGLRSFNKKMPEEINRVLSDHVSDLLLCPTLTAIKNLKAEGLVRNVHMVGDVMYDSLLYFTQMAEKESHVLDDLSLTSGEYCLATVHRAENINDPKNLQSIFKALDEISKNGHLVILPLHPATRKKIKSMGISIHNIRMLDPVDYLDMLVLEKNSVVILTDSGGVQKEAYWYGVPCVTLREETEWIETVETGWNILTGPNTERMVEAYRKSLSLKFTKHTSTIETNDAYGDGKAAYKILDLIGKLK
jgi:UDP-N-acetylglucosamine 2-epimerase